MSNTALQYTQNGDYLVPNIELSQPQTPLGKYGRMRRTFLKEQRPILYNHLLLSGKLYRRGGPAASRTDDARADADSGRDGGLEGPRPDGVGRPDERLQGTGRRSNSERTDLQLSFFATEAEQITQIDQKAEAEKVSAFSFSEADWRAALASGSGFENGKTRIAAYYAENHSQKERIEFLKKEYGTGGRSWTFQDGSNGFLDYDTRGVKLREYAGNREQILKWPEVEKRIHVLIATGQYLDEPEAEKPAAKRYQVIVYHQTGGGLDERQEYPTLEEAERAAQGYMNGTMEPGFRFAKKDISARLWGLPG